jgi:formylglycine-generating enzyme required for sulfatase activity
MAASKIQKILFYKSYFRVLSAIAFLSGCIDEGSHSPPAIHAFLAEPAELELGARATLTAEFRHGTARVGPEVGALVSGAPVTVSPAATTTYTLTVADAQGRSAVRRLTVVVRPALTIAIEGWEGHAGEVTVRGPGGFQRVLSASGTLRGLAPGSYLVSAAPAQVGQVTHHPWRPEQTVVVSTGTRVQVLYPAPSCVWPLAPGVPLEMVLIPAGSFILGSDDPEDSPRYPAACPPHPVTFPQAFYMARVPTTQAQWLACAAYNPSVYRQGPLYPVNSCSYRQIQADFLPRLAARFPEAGFRLPSEAQWEYACRAGSSAAYFFGPDPGPVAPYAWAYSAEGENLHPVGQKRPNPWGLQDLYGQVAQWCEDPAHDGHGEAAADGRPRAAPGDRGVERILRGHGSLYSPVEARSARRLAVSEWYDGCFCGFRLVASEPKLD